MLRAHFRSEGESNKMNEAEAEGCTSCMLFIHMVLFVNVVQGCLLMLKLITKSVNWTCALKLCMMKFKSNTQEV